MGKFKQVMAMVLDGASYSRIVSVVGCSNRDVARVRKVIASEGITVESFGSLGPEFFAEHFADVRSARSARFDQPDSHAFASRLAVNKHVSRNMLWLEYLASPCDPGRPQYFVQWSKW